MTDTPTSESRFAVPACWRTSEAQSCAWNVLAMVYLAQKSLPNPYRFSTTLFRVILYKHVYNTALFQGLPRPNSRSRITGRHSDQECALYFRPFDLAPRAFLATWPVEFAL